MGQRYTVGNASVEVSDGLEKMLDNFLDRAVPALRPAMEKAIQEVQAEVVDQWPDPRAREKFQRQRTVATQEAKEARRIARMQGRDPRGISYWDYMDNPYRPPGWRATGQSKKTWRISLDVEAGPVLVAKLYNTATKGGAKYPYMAKHPPPHDTKRYWKLYSDPAIKSRVQRLVSVMQDATHRTLKAG